MAAAFRKRQLKQTDQSGSYQYKQAVENSLRSTPLGYVVNSHRLRRWHCARSKEDTKRYTPLLNSLEDALSRPTFCCGGSLEPSEMKEFVLKVKSKSSAEADEENWKEFKVTNLPLDELLECCDPAPFGDLVEMKTVVDSEVRLAYEVKSERFKIGTENEATRFQRMRMFGDFPGGRLIKQHIEETLTPGRYVSLDRYKLNVYSKGGFFKPHVDTPSGNEMIGTLVLCLPSPHRGGELCVNHDGSQHVFDFSRHSGDTTRIQWAAFYSDCIHEVKPVIEGHRVTVTYNITLPKEDYNLYKSRRFARFTEPLKAASVDFEASAESPSLTAKALANVNSELEKIRCQSQPPSRVGFLLKFKYILGGLHRHFLKGEDKVLFDFLVGKQWKCKLMCVLSRYQTTLVATDFEPDLDESDEIYEFKPSLETLPPMPPVSVPPSRPSHSPSKKSRSSSGGDYRQWRVGTPFLEIYGRAGKQLLRNNKGHSSRLGNDAEDIGVDKIYLDSAVIVELCDEPA